MRHRLFFGLPLCTAVLSTLLLLPAGCGKKKKSDSDSSSDSSSDPTQLSSFELSRLKQTSANNLKMMGLAIHAYHDTHGEFPLAAICDANGNPLLSWRVAILPFLEYDSLYKQFRLNEPWNSDHNKQLLSQIPKVYQNPGRVKPGDTTTYYRVFAGVLGADPIRPVFLMPTAGRKPPQRATSFGNVSDGSSNTLLIFEAEEGVPWTKPEEFFYDAKKPLPRFSFFYNGASNVVFCDGSVRAITNKVSEKTLRTVITMNDGMITGNDW